MADQNTDPWAALKPVGQAADPWAALKPVGTPGDVQGATGGVSEMNPDGTFGKPPPGFVMNPYTGLMEDLRSPANPNVPTGTANAMMLGLGQGLGYGTLDEVVSGLSRLTGGDEAANYSREVMREAERRAQEDNAASFMVPQVVGSVASSLSAGKALKGLAGGMGLTQAAAPVVSAVTSRLPNIVNKAAAGAALGATDAALYGFGSGEGGFSERAGNAGDNALIGALFGGAIPVAQATLRPVMRGTMNLASAPFSSQAKPANAGRAVERAMSRASMTQDDVAAALQRAADEGQPMFTIADAIGDPGRGILNGVMRQPGPARTVGADFLMQRQAGQGDRLGRFISEALDAPDTAAARAASLTAARDTAADTAFSNVRGNATPVDVRDVLATIDARVTPMQGVNVDPGPIDKALMGIRNRLASRTPAADVVPGAAAPTAGAAGAKTAVELSDFNRVFALRKEVRDEMNAAYRADRGELGSELKAVLGALDTALEGASDEYRSAMGAYRAASDNIRAVEAGVAGAGRVRPEDVMGDLSGMTPDQVAAYKTGYADPMITRIVNDRPGTNKAVPLTSDKNRELFGALASDPDLLARRVGRENEMFRTGGRVMNGSATVDNLGDVTDAARSTATLIGQSAINPVWALRRFAGNVANAAINGVTGDNEATRAEIARAMLSSDIGSALAPLFAARQRTSQADNLAALLARTSANRANAEYGGN